MNKDNAWYEQLPELVLLPSIFGDPTRQGSEIMTMACAVGPSSVRKHRFWLAADRCNEKKPHERAADELHRRAAATED
jgi:hypothetical protein